MKPTLAFPALAAALLCALLFSAPRLHAQCSGCTITLSSNSSTNYTVSAGTVLCINSGVTYSGTITLNGGTVCNLGTITGTVNQSSGTFNNYGSVGTGLATGTLNLSGGTTNNNGNIVRTFTQSNGSLVNNATFTPTSFTYTGGQFINNPAATATTPSSMTQFLLDGSNEDITNSGTLTINGELKLNHTGASLTNSGTLNLGTSTQNLTKTSGTATNTGTISANIITFGAGTATNDRTINCTSMTVNGNGSFTNNRTLNVTGAGTNDLNIATGSTLTNAGSGGNFGLITVSDAVVNLGTLNINNGSRIVCTNFGNVNTVNGPSLNNGCGVISISATSTNMGVINGYADICDATPPSGTIKIDNNSGTVAGTVTFCVCCVLATPSISGVSSICLGASANLTANSSGGGGPGGYAWSPGGGATQTVTVTPVSTTTYSVTMTYANSCTRSASHLLTVNPVPTANAGPDLLIAVGASTNIGGSPTASGGSGAPYTYSWTPTTGLTTPTSANPSANPGVTTTYTVVVTDVQGCTATDNMLLVVPAYFAVPARKLDAGYYEVKDNRVFFSFQEEYKETVANLSYAIYTDQHALVSGLPALPEAYGDNRYALDVTSLLTPGYYVLEIANEKNEKWYLRIKK